MHCAELWLWQLLQLGDTSVNTRALEIVASDPGPLRRRLALPIEDAPAVPAVAPAAASSSSASSSSSSSSSEDKPVAELGPEVKPKFILGVKVKVESHHRAVVTEGLRVSCPNRYTGIVSVAALCAPGASMSVTTLLHCI